MADKPEKTSLNSKDESRPARKFWELWQKGTPPDLGEFLEQAGTLKPMQMAAVLCVDLRERWKRQERARPEDYLNRYPQVLAEAEAALDVVYCEFLLRDELGEAPTAAEYAQRFPQLKSELSRQIEMHRMLQGEGEQSATAEPAGCGPDIPVRPTRGPVSTDRNVRATRPTGDWPSLPGYQILDRLGRGGMGVVYKAWQEQLFRVVAVKMLQADPIDAGQALARFEVEKEAIARLQHPNILQVYEVGWHDVQPFMVMEYADGGTLAKKLDGTPWAARPAAQLVETLARAVQYAHQRGVVHRDLTPGNILFQNADCRLQIDNPTHDPVRQSAISNLKSAIPKIGDFGLAKLMVGGQSLTRTGAVVGTPSYMSPEQASGSMRDSGPAMDIWALGAMLFELLTGRPPFKAATALETLAMVAHIDPVAPRQLQPSVPRDLETICVKCLRKEPARRYTSSAELADDLHRFLAGEPIRARPVSSLERVWRWGRRNPGWASALVMLILTAIGALAANYYYAKALRTSEHALYRSKVDEAREKRLNNGRIGQRFHSLKLLGEARKLAERLRLGAEDFRELRNEVIACLALSDLELLKEWDGFSTGTYGLDFDEKLQLYARGDVQGAVSVRRISDDEEIASFPGQGEPAVLRFSPDGQRLAVHSGENLRLWDIAAKQHVDWPEVKHFSFTAQGRQVAVLHGDGKTVTIHDPSTGAEKGRFEPLTPSPLPQGERGRGEGGGAIVKLVCHPRQDVLAVAAGKEVFVVDLKSKKSSVPLPHPDRVCCLSWSEDGRVLASGCDDKVIRIWELDAMVRSLLAPAAAPISAAKPTPRPPQIVGHGTQGMVIMLNRDGTLLASSNFANNLRIWDTRAGQPLVMPLVEAGLFRFAADADLLACTAPGGKLRLYRTLAGREFRRLPPYNRHGARNVVFHPTGRLLLAAGEGGLACLDTEKIEVRELPLEGWARQHANPGKWTIPIGFDARGALFTQSVEGFNYWPPLSDPTRPELIRLDRPKLLAPRGNGLRSALGGSARVLAVPDFDNGARVIFLDETDKKTALCKEVKLGPQKDVRCCAVSPDGQFVAAGVHDAPGQPGAVVWEARSGRRVKELPVLARQCDVDFSPDGRWLITSGGGCRLWETESWKPGPVLGGSAFAFAHAGKLLAVEGIEGQIRLVDPETGAEFARLTALGELHSLPVCFNHDASLLAVYGTESQALHVWDLRAVRAHLQSVGLDWDLPAYEPAGMAPFQMEMVER